MCGIAGFFGYRHTSAETIEAMRRAIARRGPDAFHVAGRKSNKNPFLITNSTDGLQSAILHARLSIRDPSPQADQPMSSDDGLVWICYNGEVYGWDTDQSLLQMAGHRFHTTSDTEFILRAYLQWGWQGLLPRLRGMFALVIADFRVGKVFVARDRMGLKPLVYYHDESRAEFAFSSLVRGVLPYVPADRRQLSSAGIDAFLAHRTIPAPGTVFRHLQRLENAHCLEFELATGRLLKSCYWLPNPSNTDGYSWQRELDKAIALRTASDRPVGLFLSSGIDSAALACRLSAQNYRNIQTFTASFSNPEMDESERAGFIATSLGLTNTIVPIPDSPAEDFVQIVADLDEPFADPSSFPTWYLARAAAKHVKVVLCGDGGDEMFGGYKRYHQHLRTAWRRRWSPLACLRPEPGVFPSKRQRLALEASLDWLSAYPMRFSGVGMSERAALQPDIVVAVHYWRLPEELEHLGPLQQLLAVDRENYLPEYILRKADLLTMAHGLEGRAPLLDHVLVEKVMAMPDAERFSRPAKQALAAVCPEYEKFDFFSRKKMGFNPPVAALLASLADRLEGLPVRLANSTGGQFDVRVLKKAVSLWQKSSGYGEQLLQLLILDESLQQLKQLE